MISVGLFCHLYKVSGNVLDVNKGFGLFKKKRNFVISQFFAFILKI